MSHPNVTTRSLWATSSYGEHSDSSPIETSALCDHLRLCSGETGRFFQVRCGAEAVHRFVAGRFVTTLAFVTAVLGLVAWLS
jgi:hypothetical protein